jgi:hypothetical protein
MTTAVYIKDGVVQLVLTPENQWEEDAIKSFEERGAVETEIYRGQFYNCVGGWTRWKRQSGYGDDGDRSLILRTKAKP